MTYETELEFAVVIEFDYHAGCRGHRDKYGAPEEPDEDAWVEITSVKIGTGEHAMDVMQWLEQEQVDELAAEIQQSYESDQEPDDDFELKPDDRGEPPF